MSAGNGVIFAAFGRTYIDLAFQAAESLRRNAPGLEVDLFTETAMPPGPFDRVHVLEEVWIRSKLDAMLRSRFDRTLYLDADLLVVADPGDIFEVLDRFDLAITHDQNRNSSPGRVEYRRQLPNAFPQFNGGVIGFRRSPQMQDFLETWKQAIRDHGIGKDQPSLRELLWDSSLRVAVLPPEYNLWDLSAIDRLTARHHAAPRIIHSSLFVRKPLPRAGQDPLGHYIGAARAQKTRMLLAADYMLARRAGRSPGMPSLRQRLGLRGLYLLDWMGRKVRDFMGDP